MREETEEEFLARYAAAAGESIEAVEEGDIDEETQDIELGKLLEPFSLSDIYHKIVFLLILTSKGCFVNICFWG